MSQSFILLCIRFCQPYLLSFVLNLIFLMHLKYFIAFLFPFFLFEQHPLLVSCLHYFFITLQILVIIYLQKFLLFPALYCNSFTVAFFCFDSHHVEARERIPWGDKRGSAGRGSACERPNRWQFGEPRSPQRVLVEMRAVEGSDPAGS